MLLKRFLYTSFVMLFICIFSSECCNICKIFIIFYKFFENRFRIYSQILEFYHKKMVLIHSIMPLIFNRNCNVFIIQYFSFFYAQSTLNIILIM